MTTKFLTAEQAQQLRVFIDERYGHLDNECSGEAAIRIIRALEEKVDKLEEANELRKHCLD